MEDFESRKYEVLHEDGQHLVVDWKQRTVMRCGDIASAQHYAVLLTQTYRAGYKDGYRAAKEAS